MAARDNGLSEMFLAAGLGAALGLALGMALSSPAERARSQERLSHYIETKRPALARRVTTTRQRLLGMWRGMKERWGEAWVAGKEAAAQAEEDLHRRYQEYMQRPPRCRR